MTSRLLEVARYYRDGISRATCRAFMSAPADVEHSSPLTTALAIIPMPSLPPIAGIAIPRMIIISTPTPARPARKLLRRKR